MTHARNDLRRLRVAVRGAVQGVGFRPFVYRLARQLDLTGWVLNSSQGVFLEVEGPPDRLETFFQRLQREKPRHAVIHSLDAVYLDPAGYVDFVIRESQDEGEKTVLILPDIATCPDCLREVFDPTNRRYRYPFTNCTNCGPRYSIILALPYDRPNTTMRGFSMCEECRAEYENPLDRRFHAQPNACPHCGPHLELWDPAGRRLASHDEALRAAAQALREGAILAVKGLGGFHLMVDARNQDAVLRLRQRKARGAKPFALMYPDVDMVKAHCHLSLVEEGLLTSPEAPIVLLRRRKTPLAQGQAHLPADAVAPDNPYLGVMLPYTPLHHLLLQDLGFPVVATSGNRSEEPICTDEHEALERLAGMADLFLVHNRPIARHVDDSVVCVVQGRPLVLRRARGYAPLPVFLERPLPPALAVGGHLKNTVAVTVDRQVVLSQHIGDLETEPAYRAFRQVLHDLQRLYQVRPQRVACDAHPDYLSTHFARRTGLPVTPVQHHYAHILACMAENHLDAPVLGVAWDGTGYGPDGTVWGGEFLVVAGATYRRVAHFRTFPLPGGEKAIREPRRTALGLLYEMLGNEVLTREDLPPLRVFSETERRVLQRMLAHGLNTPRTSSAGRLFDVVASLLNLCQVMQFEGQAAMALEFALPEDAAQHPAYPLPLRDVDGETWVVDWEPLFQALLEDLARGESPGAIAARFHNALVEAIVAVARRVGLERVVLSGGCFQNRYLLAQSVVKLERAGFRPYWPQRIPPNDGGIALGQAVALALHHSRGARQHAPNTTVGAHGSRGARQCAHGRQ